MTLGLERVERGLRGRELLANHGEIAGERVDTRAQRVVMRDRVAPRFGRGFELLLGRPAARRAAVHRDVVERGTALVGASSGHTNLVEQRSQQLVVGFDREELFAYRGRVGDERLHDAFVGDRGQLALQPAGPFRDERLQTTARVRAPTRPA